MTTCRLFLSRLILGLTASVLICASAQADDLATRVSVVRGEAVTGANRLLGEPIYSYDFAPNPTFGFNTVDELNPVGPLPAPLSAASDRSAVLVTTFANLAAVPPDVLPNLNIPLRDVGTFVNGLLDRAAVPFQSDPGAPVIGPTQAEPGRLDPITLGDWLSGRGTAIAVCGQHANVINIFVNRLIPNRMYSAIALWLRDDGSFRPVALGGVPNVFMTNQRGAGNLSRKLNFCPGDVARYGIGPDRLIGIAVIYHSAHVAWGAIPSPGAPGLLLPPGSMVHGHLWFDFGAGRRLAE